MWANAQRDGRPAEYTWRPRHWAKFHQGALAPENVYIMYQPGDGQTSCKVWLASGERRCCSNEANTWNPLKFAGVPQTPEPISAASELKFAILWGHVKKILLFHKFFFPIVDTRLRCKDIAGQSSAMVCRWQFLCHFCVLYFQWAACGTFQTCILNSH